MPHPYSLHAANGTTHVAGGRVVARPAPGSLDVDLLAYDVRPGWVNAHDHLELNHYPRTRFREVYDNAHQWGRDVDMRLRAGLYSDLRAHTLWHRCLIGGVKNLLSGVTTVAHHGPLHRPLRRRGFPVRVLQRYGWAHSLYFDTPAAVRASYDATPPDVSWFIHLAEGTDAVAAGEYHQLQQLGCVGPNTVIVHGVGLTPEDVADAAPRVRGLVFCLTTNHYLLGKTPDVDGWIAAGGLAVPGTDSRLTADGDMFDELAAGGKAPTTRAAQLLGLDDVGHLEPGAHADLAAGCGRRSALPLIMVGGVPQIGDPAIMNQFEHIPTVPVTLDGIPKQMNARLAGQLQRCALHEPGLALHHPARRRFWL